VETSPEVREKIAPLQEILSFALNCKELVLCGPGEKTPPKQAAVGESIYGRVIVDTELTEELRAEALVREIVRRFQVMRKEMSLEMEERVDAEVCMKTESLELIKRMVDYIKREVRIRNLHLSSTPQFAGFRKEFDLDGEVCVLTLRKI
jgi:isoleucyl-tRNA synthetase